MMVRKQRQFWEDVAIYWRILYYFFCFPNIEIGLNALSEKLNASKTSTKNAVLALVEEGFIKKEEIGKAWRLRINTQDPYLVTRRISYNLQLVYESRIIARIYNKIPEAKSIALFGSYRWGTNDEKSDLDIAVEVLGNKPLEIIPLEKITLGFRTNVQVNLHVFSRTKIDLNLFTNIANGIVLDGLLEVHP